MCGCNTVKREHFENRLLTSFKGHDFDNVFVSIDRKFLLKGNYPKVGKGL